MTPARRTLLLLAGHASVALGVIGAFLPLLPTTPFLLLAAACYMRASERHHRWLMEHRILGPYIRQFQAGRSVPWRAKIVALALIWTSLLFSAWRVDRLPLQAMILTIGVGVTIYLVRLPSPTGTEDERES